MYAWCMLIDDEMHRGRTWGEWLQLINELHEATPDGYTVVIYVHNLSYEFQFFRKLFKKVSRVLTTGERNVIKCTVLGNIEFRCSLALTNGKLEKVGATLRNPIPKLVGELDYSLVRHSETPLTDREWDYIEHDVKIVVQLIREHLEDEGSIGNIPLTSTGYVRREFRRVAKYNPYTHDLVRGLTLTPRIYYACRQAYMGGFVHGSCWTRGVTLDNVTSWDISSSYPAAMVAFEYPMSPFVRCDIKDWELLRHTHACLIHARLTNVEAIIEWEHVLSASKCAGLVKGVVDNGRIVTAKACEVWITDVDYDYLKDYYIFDIEVLDLFCAKRGKLPKPYIKKLLEMYNKKTTLKGVAGKEYEYGLNKAMINSVYGMCVERVIRENPIYRNHEWEPERLTAEEVQERIKDYNDTYSRALYYPWGVWISAYARRSLLKVIEQVGYDYAYADTDSVKCRGDHSDIFEQYNTWITHKIESNLLDRGIDPALAHPKTIDGRAKPLGIFENEGTYEQFKTLGAKRYMYRKDDKLQTVISGVDSHTAPVWFEKEAVKRGCSPFDIFDKDLIIPHEGCNRSVVSYIDDEHEGDIIDYLGNPGHYYAPSAIHIGEIEYAFRTFDAFAITLREQATLL